MFLDQFLVNKNIFNQISFINYLLFLRLNFEPFYLINFFRSTFFNQISLITFFFINFFFVNFGINFQMSSFKFC